MKHTIFVLAFSILILLSSCTSHADKGLNSFTLTGELIGQDTGKISLSYQLNESRFNGTGIIKDGKFIFASVIQEPVRVTLNLENKENNVRFFIEPGDMKIVLYHDDFKNYELSGSKTQEEMNLLREMFDPVFDRMGILRKQEVIIRDSIRNSTSITQREKFEKMLGETIHQRYKANEDQDSVTLKFAKEHPNSYVAPRYLFRLVEFDKIDLETLKSIFEDFGTPIQNSEYGKRIDEHIKKKEVTAIGAVAPDFKAHDINQNLVSLQQFRNNIVILDFWASWCGSCRRGIPFLKELYHKYHSQGLEIIGVSKDHNQDDWKAAIKEDSSYLFHHIPIAENYSKEAEHFTQDDIISNYYIQVIPVTILIDRDGRIAGRWVGSGEENEFALEEKIKEIIAKQEQQSP